VDHLYGGCRRRHERGSRIIPSRYHKETGLQAAGLRLAKGFSSYFYYKLSTMLSSTPSRCVVFITYEYAGDLRQVPMVAASIAGGFRLRYDVPTELIKQRMQTHQYASLSNAFRSISAERSLDSMVISSHDLS
jgi:hypothetical protein